MTPDPPRYGSRDVGVLIDDAVAALTRGARRALPLPDGPDGVVVFVVDGLGQRQLQEHAAVAPFMTTRPGITLDAPFPATTTTSLTSIGTGRAPGEHGLVGFSVAVPGDTRPLVLLTWSWERQDLDLDAREEVVPEDFQPLPTAFDRAREAGVRPVTVLRPEFPSSGLTRAGLRGAEVVEAVGLEATLAAAVEAAAAPGPCVVYAHHGDLDAIGHIVGPATDRWCGELARIDAELARLADQLPRGVVAVVTADHGMLPIPSGGHIELTERPELLDGVRVLTGDGRARQLHVHAGANDHVLAAWRESCGDLAYVLSREEAIDLGWFGPVVTDVVRPRIGDVVVSARARGVAFVHRDADLFGGRLAGMHGALTPEEIEVPALVLTRDDRTVEEP